jgi:succinoglycan biosynthesis transport protein ExoP
LLQVVRARRSWIVVPTLPAFVAGLVFVTLVSPRYTAFTKVLLENEENYFTRPDKATLDLAAPYDPEAVQSEAEMIATADLARKAIAKLGLMEKSEFKRLAVESGAKRQPSSSQVRRAGVSKVAVRGS